MPRTAVTTIVSKNYLPYARTLMASLAEKEPSWDRWVLLVDRLDGACDPAGEAFRLLEVEHLPIPPRDRMLFHYNILELNTAVKPWLLDWLFREKGYDRAIYIDPDIRVYAPLDEVTSALDSGTLAVLTPHLTGRLRDDRSPSELDILRAGTYNLGFVALGRHAALPSLLDYWCEKSVTEFASDPARGLFTDQKWMDLVPGIWDDVTILRHPGYNVAYWNLAHRPVRREGDRWTVDGRPLVFFHFSGLDPSAPEKFSKHQNRFTLETVGEAKDLALGYCREMLAQGYEEFRRLPYAFGFFDDGTPVPQAVRTLHRRDAAFRALLGSSPFAADPALLDRPWVEGDGAPPVTWMMRAIWEIRDDLRAAFPDPAGAQRHPFAAWWVGGGGAEAGVADRHVAPLRDEFSRHPEWRGAEPPPRDSRPASGPGRRRFFWGGAPEPVELARYGIHLQSESDCEHGLAWMAGEAHFHIAGAAGRTIRIRGAHRPHFLERAGLGPEMTLAVAIGEEAIGTIRLRSDGPFSARFRVPRDAGDPVTLRIRPSATFVPSVAGINDDPRVLSVQLREIAVGGVSLVNFSGRAPRLPAAPPPGVVPPPSTAPHAPFAPDVAGFYDRDAVDRQQGFAWMAPRATVRIPRPKAGERVLFAGEHNAHWIARTHAGDPTQTFELRLGGELLGKATIREGGPFRVEGRIPDRVPPASADGVHLLEIVADRSFCPARAGREPDIRVMACRAARLEVGKAVVLDFSRPDGKVLLAPPPPGGSLGINVIGYARAMTGIGQSCRDFARSCEAAGIPHELFDFRDGLGGGTPGPSRLLENGPPHGVNVFHVNADQVPVVAPLLGEKVFGGRWNVGVWHWELPELPDEWLSSFGFLDEIWAPTRFVLDAVAAKSPIPVVHIPHGVSVSASPSASRARFGLPEDRFLVLVMYDSASYQSRKNPEAALAAFERAFPRGRSDVGLVVKTMNASGPEFDALAERIARMPGSVLISEQLERQEVYDLESVVDCYLSLHRAEGWGYNLIESMLLGKPVVATGWSGNADFMTPANSCPVDSRLVPLDRDFGPYRAGQLWAEPDVEQAARFLRQLADDRPFRERIAAAGLETARTQHSHETAGAKIRARLSVLARRGAK